MLLIQSSDPKGITFVEYFYIWIGQAFIETKNLDGETNLKHKTVPKPLMAEFKSATHKDEVLGIVNVLTE